MRIGFLGLGVMGLPMAINVVKKSGCEVLGFDVVPKRLEEFKEAGGVPITNTDEIYTTCDVVMQMRMISSKEKALLSQSIVPSQDTLLYHIFPKKSTFQETYFRSFSCKAFPLRGRRHGVGHDG